MGEKEVAICRICLMCDFGIPSKGLSLFEEYNDCVISDKINALTNVGIKAGDGLPDRICLACLVELESAYSFKKKCEKTNEILLSAINNDPIKVEIFDTSIPMKEDETIDNNCNVIASGKEKESKNNNLDIVFPANENDNTDITLPEKEKELENDNTVIDLPVKEEELDDDNIEIALPKEEKHLEGNNVDITQPIIKEEKELGDSNVDITQTITEEYLEDSGDFDYEDVDENNTTQSDLKAADADISSQVELSRPSRAIDFQLECHDCGGFFKSKCKLRMHWKRVHLPENTVQCPKCLIKLKSYVALNSHKKKNLKSCAIASKVRIEGEGKNRIFHCHDCDYKSTKIHSFQNHFIKHTGERPFQCDLCSKAFSQSGKLTEHKESAHKLYRHEGTCHFCGKHIQGRSKFNLHIRRHKNVPCKICNVVLKGRNGLFDHMKRHSGIKAYACELCGKTFYTGSELAGHRNKTHLKIKKVFRCEICNYTCSTNWNLAKHKAKHTATNVGCDVCGFFVDNEQQLVCHKERHTEKNYQCSECEKRFYSPSTLRNHLSKIHKTVRAGCG